jgi:tetratricopeptide (TPR) repeat protein
VSQDQVGTEETVASAPATDATVTDTVSSIRSSGQAPVLVRAGGGADYNDLVMVDPHHYVMGNELARGGMGRVLVARDRRLGRTVAIKEVLGTTPEARVRFEREARITAGLQHPSIVNIHEAGTWPDGVPFYAMKLVTGRTLSAVIAECDSLERRLALLPQVIAITDALAYAHSERVIHRDLKPGNVIVGEFGETVVIDWGLAKSLSEVDERRGSATDPAAPDLTMDGDVMGTPAYMPLEQAVGDVVDQRADVYALGAILYNVLAGAPPVIGADTQEVLAKLLDGDIEPLSRRAPSVPPELVTIVDKAMARAAQDRYPSARELADDLKTYQAGKLVSSHRYSLAALVRRWLRRHRAILSVAGAAVVVLIVMGVLGITRIIREQENTEAQRLRAEQHRAGAEELITYMLGELRDKVQPLNQLALLRSLATKVSHYYEERANAAPSVDELGRQAAAHRNLGDVWMDAGSLERAAVDYRAALNIERGLAVAEPELRAPQAGLATSWSKLASVLTSEGDLAAAMVAEQNALALRAGLVAHGPASIEEQAQLAKSHHLLSKLLVTRADLTGALEHARAGFAIESSLSATRPEDRELSRDVALGHDNIGRVLAAQGDTAGALTEIRASLAIREASAARDPDDAVLLGDVMASHALVGAMLADHDDVKAGLVELRSALELAERLASGDPANTKWARDLIIARVRIGDALRRRDPSASLVEYRAARPLATQLAARDPRNAMWSGDLAGVLDRIGSVLEGVGDPAALDVYRQALATDEAIVALDPTNGTQQRNLSVAHNKIGNILFARKDSAGALREYRVGQRLVEAVAARDPSSAEWQVDVASSHANIADALEQQNASPEVVAERRAAIAVFERLNARDPGKAVYVANLRVLHGVLGHALLALGDRAGLVEMTAAIDYAQQAVAAHPDDALATYGLLSAHWNLGEALDTLHEGAEARAAFLQAAAVGEHLVATAPKNPRWASELKEVRDKLRTCCQR